MPLYISNTELNSLLHESLSYQKMVFYSSIKNDPCGGNSGYGVFMGDRGAPPITISLMLVDDPAVLDSLLFYTKMQVLKTSTEIAIPTSFDLPDDSWAAFDQSKSSMELHFSQGKMNAVIRMGSIKWKPDEAVVYISLVAQAQSKILELAGYQ